MGFGAPHSCFAFTLTRLSIIRAMQKRCIQEPTGPQSASMASALCVDWATPIRSQCGGLDTIRQSTIHTFLPSSPHYSGLYYAEYPYQFVCTPYHVGLVYSLLCPIRVWACAFPTLYLWARRLKWTPLDKAHPNKPNNSRISQLKLKMLEKYTRSSYPAICKWLTK